jgi:hypothetical protein
VNEPSIFQLLAAYANRAQRVEILQRTGEKARRGAELRPWAMGVKPRLVDHGSSLALDDDGFMTAYAGDMVSGTAVFPIMNAVDSLTAVAELIDGRDDSGERKGSGDHHTSSIFTLTRMAAESAATTIWLLSNPDRAVRRSLSVRFTASELNAQRAFHSYTRKWHERGPGQNEPDQYAKFRQHVRLFDERVKMLEQGMQQTPATKVKGSGDVVAAAAKWLDQHPPQHDSTDLYGNAIGFEDVAARFYNLNSAIVHGLKWPLDYMPNGEIDMARMIVEGVNIAVTMGECAVALVEAQAQSWTTETDRPILYPDRLQPSVEAWADLFPADQSF